MACLLDIDNFLACERNDSFDWCGGGSICNVHTNEVVDPNSVPGDPECPVRSHSTLQHQSQGCDKPVVTKRKATIARAKWLISISMIVMTMIFMIYRIQTNQWKRGSLKLGVSRDQPSSAPSAPVDLGHGATIDEFDDQRSSAPSNTVQPSSAPINTVQPSSTRTNTVQPSSAHTNAVQPSSAPSNTVNYEYYRSENSKCSENNEANWQGPTPRSDNTVLQFFAFGDVPYDDNANTCIGIDDLPQISCTRYNCLEQRLLPIENTCTYEGSEYRCLKDNIIPYINDKVVNGDAAFALHVGDFIKGGTLASNKRCSEASFESRKTLFNQCTNLLLSPGDNEWNDCVGYDINSNNDEMRQLWRDKFANEKSPFHQFSYDFPSTFTGDRPHIIRDSNNPEILFFSYNDIGIFGLNLPAGDTYINDKSSVDINAQWVEGKLDKDRCNLKSIVLFGHAVLSTEVKAKLQDYYNVCSTIPTLFINGNGHPSTYCMKRSNDRFILTVEAFQSGPLLVSIVHDKDGNHYFHVKDKDMVDSNRSCPDLLMSDD
eukprot:scaffold2532_cov79-Skeletonema_menzelii.AAC.9